MSLEQTKQTNYEGEIKATQALSQGRSDPKSGSGALPPGSQVSGGAQAVLALVMIELAALCRKLMDLQTELSVQELKVLAHKNQDGSLGGILVGISDAIVGAANAQASATTIQGYQAITSGITAGMGAVYSLGFASRFLEKCSSTYKSPETRLAIAEKNLAQFDKIDQARLNGTGAPANQAVVQNGQDRQNYMNLLERDRAQGFDNNGNIKDTYSNQVRNAAKQPEFKQELQTRLQNARADVRAITEEIYQRPMQANMVTSAASGMSSGISNMVVASKQKEQGEQQACSEVLRTTISLVQEVEQDLKQKANEAFSEAMQYIQGSINAMMSAAVNT
jgi:hypothetical protein